MSSHGADIDTRGFGLDFDDHTHVDPAGFVSFASRSDIADFLPDVLIVLADRIVSDRLGVLHADVVAWIEFLRRRGRPTYVVCGPKTKPHASLRLRSLVTCRGEDTAAGAIPKSLLENHASEFVAVLTSATDEDIVGSLPVNWAPVSLETVVELQRAKFDSDTAELHRIIAELCFPLSRRSIVERDGTYRRLPAQEAMAAKAAAAIAAAGWERRTEGVDLTAPVKRNPERRPPGVLWRLLGYTAKKYSRPAKP